MRQTEDPGQQQLGLAGPRGAGHQGMRAVLGQIEPDRSLGAHTDRRPYPRLGPAGRQRRCGRLCRRRPQECGPSWPLGPGQCGRPRPLVPWSGPRPLAPCGGARWGGPRPLVRRGGARPLARRGGARPLVPCGGIGRLVRQARPRLLEQLTQVHRRGHGGSAVIGGAQLGEHCGSPLRCDLPVVAGAYLEHGRAPARHSRHRGHQDQVPVVLGGGGAADGLTGQYPQHRPGAVRTVGTGQLGQLGQLSQLSQLGPRSVDPLAGDRMVPHCQPPRERLDRTGIAHQRQPRPGLWHGDESHLLRPPTGPPTQHPAGVSGQRGAPVRVPDLPPGSLLRQHHRGTGSGEQRRRVGHRLRHRRLLLLVPATTQPACPVPQGRPQDGSHQYHRQCDQQHQPPRASATAEQQRQRRDRHQQRQHQPAEQPAAQVRLLLQLHRQHDPGVHPQLQQHRPGQHAAAHRERPPPATDPAGPARQARRRTGHRGAAGCHDPGPVRRTEVADAHPSAPVADLQVRPGQARVREHQVGAGTPADHRGTGGQRQHAPHPWAGEHGEMVAGGSIHPSILPGSRGGRPVPCGHRPPPAERRAPAGPVSPRPAPPPGACAPRSAPAAPRRAGPPPGPPGPPGPGPATAPPAAHRSSQPG